MFSVFSLKALLLFLLLLLVVGCTIFTMQGMLPLNNGDPGVLTRIDNDDDDSAIKSAAPPNQISKVRTPKKMAAASLPGLDLLAEKLSANLAVLMKNVKIAQNKVHVMDRNLFYREAYPPEGVIPTNQNAVLLHGMNFKSQTWENLTTIGLLAAMGHRVVAFDLPGYGETGGEQIPMDERGDFLNAALMALHLTDPVVVSPSMSGTFSLPYLFKYPGKMAGYVTVAPVTTDKYSMEDYQSVKTPTLIIYGEQDDQLGETSTQNLRNIPNSQVQMLKDARHPAYLDQPATFHTLLYNFFLLLRGR